MVEAAAGKGNSKKRNEWELSKTRALSMEIVRLKMRIRQRDAELHALREGKMRILKQELVIRELETQVCPHFTEHAYQLNVHALDIYRAFASRVRSRGRSGRRKRSNVMKPRKPTKKR